ncbi:MAG TPA: nucleotide exchange factor GrpE, partial [Gaiellaceae bacterium]|nr:nucleotide exchange factor GrpE [Gaiellaceae bacterium]
MSDELTQEDVEIVEPEPEAAPAPDPLMLVMAERDEYLALAQRVQADFENYRKRAAREQERLVAHAHERLVRELLPILDDLERALEAAERHEEAQLVEGVKLVEQSLR